MHIRHDSVEYLMSMRKLLIIKQLLEISMYDGAVEDTELSTNKQLSLIRYVCPLTLQIHDTEGGSSFFSSFFFFFFFTDT
jgi:hypothetical protein